MWEEAFQNSSYLPSFIIYGGRMPPSKCSRLFVFQLFFWAVKPIALYGNTSVGYGQSCHSQIIFRVNLANLVRRFYFTPNCLLDVKSSNQSSRSTLYSMFVVLTSKQAFYLGFIKSLLYIIKNCTCLIISKLSPTLHSEQDQIFGARKREMKITVGFQ